MPGVYRAVAGDLDGDGDLDVAACAMIPDSLLNTARGNSSGSSFDAVLWLEQVRPGGFDRHSLQTIEGGGSLALNLGDFNEDGRLDIAVGTFAPAALATDDPRRTWITLWYGVR